MSRIAILTLTDQRDLAVDKRIADALRKLGHETLVRAYATAGRWCVCYEKPEVVIAPMVGSENKLDFVKRCHEWGITVIVRRGEAGAAVEVLKTMDPERQKVIVGNFDYAPYVDLELTWGAEFSDILAQRRRIKIVPCGPFTLDACFDRTKVHRPPGKKTLLLATGWSGADDDPNYSECGADLNSPLQRSLYRLHRKGRDDWLHMIRHLHLTKSHKYELLLKVRPGESTAEYIREVGQFVKVLPYDFPSADAILLSDCVIHTGSTMAVEAHLLGVPSINYCNCNPDPRVADMSVRCSDVGELEAALGRMQWGQSNIDREKLAWLQEHLYGVMDGKSCQRAAKAVDHLIKSRAKVKGKTKLCIPDQWPRDVIHTAQGVSAEAVPGWLRVNCMGCHGAFHIDPNAPVIWCPYCALTMRKVLQPYVKTA